MSLTNYQYYSIVLLAVGVASMVAAFVWLFLTPDNLDKWEKVPRYRTLGAIIGLIDLLWCIPNTKPLLPVSLHVFLLPLAFTFAYLGWQFLDYLLSRAIGGFLILLAHYLLANSFAFKTPAAPVLAGFCMAIGIVGLFFAGKPYLFRDLIRKSAKFPVLKFSVSASLFVFALLSIIPGIMQLVQRQG